jgi:hypothetical protein
MKLVPIFFILIKPYQVIKKCVFGAIVYLSATIIEKVYTVSFKRGRDYRLTNLPTAIDWVLSSIAYVLVVHSIHREPASPNPMVSYHNHHLK